MKRDLTVFLKTIFNEKLENNRFSWVLAKFLTHEHLSRSKRVLFEEIRNFYKNNLNQDLNPFELNDSSQENTSDYDFRIKSIRASNVRGIPQKFKNHMYGIDLSDSDDNPNIALIVGSNGSGKSSLFDSLEYIYTNEIGESKLRGAISEKDFKEYLSHYNSRFSDASYLIYTNSGEYSLSNPIFSKDSEIKNLINPTSHFISEYDIYFNGQLDYEGNNDNSFHYLIAQSLGLDSFLVLKQKLYEIVEYVDRRRIETEELESKKENLSISIKNITKWEKELQQIEREIKEIENPNLESKNIPSNILPLIAVDGAYELFNDSEIDIEIVGKALNNFLDRFRKFKEVGIGKEDSDYISFINAGLNMIGRLNLSDCPFCDDSNKEIELLREEASQKLLKYKNENLIVNKTEEAYDNFILTISSTQNILKDIKENINTDIASLSYLNELNEVVNRENQLKNKFISFLNSEFVEQFDELSEIQENNQVKYKRAEDLILQYSDDYYSQLKILGDEFENFKVFREEKLDQFRAKFKESSSTKESNKITILNKNISDLNDSIEAAKNNIAHLREEVEELEYLIELNEEIRIEALKVNEIISTEINKEVQKVFDPLKSTIEEILNDYLDNNHSIEILKNHTQDQGMILTAIINKKESEGRFIKVSANKYFNSFRYKLFCTLVSCSIAIASRKNSKINLPLVLDDIFYSSDFEAKTTVATFIIKLLSIAKRYTPTMPLQLIFLTHDELIFDLARKAINNFEKNVEAVELEQGIELADFWNEDLRNNSKYFRLFPPSDLGKKPSPSIYGDYWNLVYEIPKTEISKSRLIGHNDD